MQEDLLNQICLEAKGRLSQVISQGISLICSIKNGFQQTSEIAEIIESEQNLLIYYILESIYILSEKEKLNLIANLASFQFQSLETKFEVK